MSQKEVPAPPTTVTIKPPRLAVVSFLLEGTERLVVHRFSAKVKRELANKREQGKASGSKKKREPQSSEHLFQEARYRSSEGWDGMHAGAFRNALISACRLVGFKMTLAKLSIFVLQDGMDATEPQVPLIRIHGDAVMQEDLARVETGQPYVTVRAAYFPWSAALRVRFDLDQFTIEDISNLLSRAGQQVGIGEGRPDSKHSPGMGWGLFKVTGAAEA